MMGITNTNVVIILHKNYDYVHWEGGGTLDVVLVLFFSYCPVGYLCSYSILLSLELILLSWLHLVPRHSLPPSSFLLLLFLFSIRCPQNISCCCMELNFFRNILDDPSKQLFWVFPIQKQNQLYTHWSIGILDKVFVRNRHLSH